LQSATIQSTSSSTLNSAKQGATRHGHVGRKRVAESDPETHQPQAKLQCQDISKLEQAGTNQDWNRFHDLVLAWKTRLSKDEFKSLRLSLWQYSMLVRWESNDNSHASILQHLQQLVPDGSGQFGPKGSTIKVHLHSQQDGWDVPINYLEKLNKTEFKRSARELYLDSDVMHALSGCVYPQ
jgi:hypothetical protein